MRQGTDGRAAPARDCAGCAGLRLDIRDGRLSCAVRGRPTFLENRCRGWTRWEDQDGPGGKPALQG